MRPLAASLGLDPAALECGIKTLCQESLALADWDTCEFFVCDWFRFHTFKGAGVAIAQKEFAKISSQKIASAVSRAAPWLVSKAISEEKNERNASNQRTNFPTAAASPIASATARIRTRRESGIVTYFQTDEAKATAIERKYSLEAIQAAVSIVDAREREPVPGVVEKEIEARARAAERRKVPAKDPAPSPAVSRDQCEKGLMRAWAALSKPAKEGST